MRRFLTPGVGSEFASDRVSRRSLFVGGDRDRLGFELAAGFLTEQVAQDFSHRLASLADWRFCDAVDRAGGVFMHLKLFVLSASSVVLWLAPLAALDKMLDIHKALQGLSLTAAIACAVTAGNIAREQAEQDEIEAMKAKAVKADIVDEISTSVYVSQQQRQQEAEAVLNPREQLERLLELTCDDGGRSENYETERQAAPVQNGSENAESERAERALQLKAKGWGKAKIILELWGVSKGGSPKYKAAEAEYMAIVAQAEGGESV